jgi:Mg2+/Co2+ transporter CorC
MTGFDVVLSIFANAGPDTVGGIVIQQPKSLNNKSITVLVEVMPFAMLELDLRDSTIFR